MKKIYLADGRGIVSVDDSDFDWLNQYRWIYTKTNYASTKIKGKKILMHRFILGESQADIEIDHIDGNGFNNCRSNLRRCNRSQNQHNSKIRKDNSTGYKGVTKHGDRFQARIVLNNKEIYLGLFNTAKEAGESYDQAAIKHFGDFARLNSAALAKGAK